MLSKIITVMYYLEMTLSLIGSALRSFGRISKPFGLLKYVFLPIALQCQTVAPELSATTPCAVEQYKSFKDNKGTMVNGQKATYQYYEIPFYKIVSTGKKMYNISHPNHLNECKEEVLQFKDVNNIIENAEGGDKYNIAVAMMYLNGVPTGKWYVCPSYDF